MQVSLISVSVCSGVEIASHGGHCPVNVVNVRLIETKLYTKYMGSRTRVVKIGQNVRQLAHYFQTLSVCSSIYLSLINSLFASLQYVYEDR